MDPPTSALRANREHICKLSRSYGHQWLRRRNRSAGFQVSELSELARFGTVAHRNRRDLGAGDTRAVGEKPVEPRGRRARRRLQAAA